ncbi:ankyrin repeat domain-containing protein 10-like isoform X3 [Mya arenaria]|uniref:ankyrin repeat domain-containing protein 10-like isoform X3 n=1 Tax=Mya arenaria TaxID=6604 RepID=UPI0022DEC2BE|nr:ankyrin repeat domain-containing protein 10-like isoform X3 [Mya arenaria]
MDLSQNNGNWSSVTEDILKRNFPIHRACRDGDIDHLTSLLSAGEVDLYEEDDFYGWTPIHWAAYFGKLACLRRLINTLETNGVRGCEIVSSRFSQTPAHLCAFGGHSQCLYWLIQSNCNLITQDYMGETPIHKAARTGSMECVSLLVSQGAKLSLRNHSGNTPSQVAASVGFTECANYIERAAQIQCQASGVYDEMRTPVTNPAQNGLNPISNPFCNGRASPEGQSSNQNLFISTNTYHSHPHLPANGTTHNPAAPCFENGVNHNNNNSQSDNCDMEMDETCQGVPQSIGFMNEAPNGDVLLDAAVSQNIKPLAGKKRGREEVEDECFKRARNDEPLASKCNLNGWLYNNGHMTEKSHMIDTVHMAKASHMARDSDSMMEHYDTVYVQQGYDSMVFSAMFENYHGL